MNDKKWKLILVLSLIANIAFTFSNLKRLVDINRSGTVDVCLAQGNTKAQCEAIVRLIEKSRRQNMYHSIEQSSETADRHPVRI
jgi:hypothetical protein